MESCQLLASLHDWLGHQHPGTPLGRRCGYLLRTFLSNQTAVNLHHGSLGPLRSTSSSHPLLSNSLSLMNESLRIHFIFNLSQVKPVLSSVLLQSSARLTTQTPANTHRICHSASCSVSRKGVSISLNILFNIGLITITLVFFP